MWFRNGGNLSRPPTQYVEERPDNQGGKEMKSTACAVCVAIFAAGCAGPQASVDSSASAAPGASAWYCAKERLVADGERLSCNWQPTAGEACRLSHTTVLDRASIAGAPQPAGRCNTGEWLVKATPR
jgi:hypothetical protein